jgi:hypothetical protein
MIGASAGLTLRYDGIAVEAGRQRAPRGVDRRLHVARRAVDVAVEIELQDDPRRAERARRRHLGDARNEAQRALERHGDRRRHRLGARAGQRRRDRDRRQSTRGSGDTGRRRNATAPASAKPIVSSVVATGRSMKGDDNVCIHGPLPERPRARRAAVRAARPPALQAIEGEIDDRRREERQHLAEDQAADHRDAERMAQLRAHAPADHQRQRAQQRGHRRHHDRAESAAATPRRSRRAASLPLALGVEREVDHHDRVLLHDADQQDDADDRDHVEVVAGEHRAPAARRRRARAASTGS